MILNQAVILCGGQGTRLRPLTDNIPKPMAPINGKPFLEYLLLQLKDSGITEVVLLTGYKKEVIENYFGDGSNIGINIRYSSGEVEWETAKRLYQTRDLLDENFLLLYGDNFSTLNLSKLVQFHQEKKAALTLTLFPRESSNNIAIDINNRIIAYDHSRKSSDLKYVEIGYMIVNRSIINNCKEGNISFSEVLAKIVKQENVYGFINQDQYHSISDLERLKEMEHYLTKKKIILLDRDGVINAKALPGEYITKWEEFEFLPEILNSLGQLSKKGYSFIIISNQAGIARGKYTIEDLDLIHKNMLDILREKNIDVLKIYYCPHHWEENCSCRKPLPGMFFAASKEFKFRLDHAFYLGDDERDALASENAHCRFIMIGEEYNKQKLQEYGVLPEIFVKNSEEAKNYILSKVEREIDKNNEVKK